ncbi:PstS family phosphate ABC transporter substrate-binding protein [Calycomorphotria hydatis]|uniref:Phosphate-binding protein n=1 Tax=Calycomorphotria hydatis TaxID=2528027 RepID=A0A517T713_9PLAN|nr:phosphate ABC transporter substrate-binding protein [Calycomorphotria hydatis]QDT64165.1 Phosphate-binding protein PstS precursor [Calycomorphotria hydatis]
MRNLVKRAMNIALTLVLLAVTASPVLAQVKVDPKLPEYKPVPGVSGTISSAGSDTMANLAAFWTQGFKKFYPNVKVDSEAKGSSTAVPALTESKVNFGMMSRDPKDAEINAFTQAQGYEPTVLRTSIDMLAVYVNKDNPIESMSLPQVDAVFSKTRKLGATDDITTWGQLGVEGELSARRISLYGRNAASGTYGYFKDVALGKGDYKDSVKEQPGSSAVVQGVSGDMTGIGYSGIGYKTAGVKAVALSKTDDSEPIPATDEMVYTGKYPLFRFLNLVIDHKPNQKLDPLRREFIKYIFSKAGQEAVVKDGYYPITAAIAKKELGKLGIETD